MVIAIDARAYGWTGIGRYIRNLLREYAASNSSYTFIVLIPFGSRADFLARVALPASRFSVVEVEASYYSFAEQTRFLWQLNAIKADLFHFTHFNVPLFFSRPYVVTIHDTTRFIFPGQKKQGLLQQMAYEMVFRRAVRKARGVICVSQSTQDELMRLGLALPPIVNVIYEGVSEEFLAEVTVASRQRVRAVLKTDAPYFLYVGVWMSHKNLRRLLMAFAVVKKSLPEMKLVITGKPLASQNDVFILVKELELEESVVFPGFVPADLLPVLYAEAVAFCFPSLYEGFGLPPLEAAAEGTPVLTSNVSSLPEIMGEAAVYVNPEDVEDMAAGMIEVVENEAKRTFLVRAGQARARQFDWANCAAKTLAIYELAAN